MTSLTSPATRPRSMETPAPEPETSADGAANGTAGTGTGGNGPSAPTGPQAPRPPEERDERPDGRALVDRLIAVPSSYEYRGHTAHDRVIVLDHALAGEHGGLGFLLTATLSGDHYGEHPQVSCYRRDLVIQEMRAGRAPISLSLSWDAARHLCAALAAWEAEHPDRDPEETPAGRPTPDPDDLPF